MKIAKIFIISLLSLFLVAFIAFWIYTLDYYHADESALASARTNNGIGISQSGNGLVFDPGNADTALIFYPGGKVDYSAYQPLMFKIAQQGILCILPKMPFNMAVFDVKAADAYLSDFVQIQHWYIGGHSLGGSMAASYASSHQASLEGLILLASYSVSDLSTSNLQVLSIYGDQDTVLNQVSYQKYRPNLPADFTELVMQGGNHAGFGSYGSQKGDGMASISPEEQQTETALAIKAFCMKK